MKKLDKYIKVTAILFILLFGCVLMAVALPDAKVTLQVIDENGDKMPGVDVAIGFAGVKGKTFKGISDAAGFFSASSETSGPVSYSAEKDGYYYSHGQYNMQNIDGNRWLPWNPTVQLIIRRIVKPVPMYARNTKISRLEIPSADAEIGFDLMRYEWMPPYGNGEHADFSFRLDKKYVSEDDFENTLTITFKNTFDGIQAVRDNVSNGSLFKLPRYAPETGYQPKLVRTIKRKPGARIENNFGDDNNYIFRIRSEVRDKKLIRAMYGKIQGDIKVYPDSKTAQIVFKYYLNPDYTKNLEFDPKQNLFKNLRISESVGL